MGQQVSKRLRSDSSVSALSIESPQPPPVPLSPVTTASIHSATSDAARHWHPLDEADREYILPSDDREQDRMWTQHMLLAELWGANVICEPIRATLNQPGVKILDVGCSNGVWLDAVFARYPKAEYYGVDITEAINDGESLSRANFTFANVLEGLPYADETFDYVHQRQLFTGIPRKKWVSVIDELVRVTKPGGWIELMECDIPAYRAGPIDKMLTNAIASVIEKNGLDSRCGTNLLKYVAEFNKISRDSGIQLINVTGKVVSCPKNWNGKVGEACAKDLAQFLESMQLHLQRALNISSEAYAALIVAYLEECGRFKAFGNVHCVYAQVWKV